MHKMHQTYMCDQWKSSSFNFNAETTLLLLSCTVACISLEEMKDEKAQIEVNWLKPQRPLPFSSSSIHRFSASLHAFYSRNSRSVTSNKPHIHKNKNWKDLSVTCSFRANYQSVIFISLVWFPGRMRAKWPFQCVQKSKKKVLWKTKCQ